MSNLKKFIIKKTHKITWPFWAIFLISFSLINIGDLFQNADVLNDGEITGAASLIYDIGSSIAYPLIFFEALIFFVFIFFMYHVFYRWKDDLVRLRARGFSSKSTQYQVVIVLAKDLLIVMISSIIISLIFGFIFAGVNGISFYPYLSPRFAYYFFVFVIILLFLVFSYFFFFFQFRGKNLLKMIKDLS